MGSRYPIEYTKRQIPSLTSVATILTGAYH
jgi:hypothetical protein